MSKLAFVNFFCLKISLKNNEKIKLSTKKCKINLVFIKKIKKIINNTTELIVLIKNDTALSSLLLNRFYCRIISQFFDCQKLKIREVLFSNSQILSF